MFSMPYLLPDKPGKGLDQGHSYLIVVLQKKRNYSVPIPENKVGGQQGPIAPNPRLPTPGHWVQAAFPPQLPASLSTSLKQGGRLWKKPLEKAA